MTRAKRITVKTLRPMDGGEVGDEMTMNATDAHRLEKRGLVEIVGEAADEPDADEGKQVAPPENKDAAQAGGTENKSAAPARASRAKPAATDPAPKS